MNIITAFALIFIVLESNCLSSYKFIENYHYPSEIHKITTDDGYILQIIRLPNTKTKKTPVILTHGLFGGANDWLIMGPNISLAFQLYDNDFDVWLMNCRGTRLSQNHTTLTVHDKQFWNFSWHEMGLYDIPATINYLLHVTNQTKVIHIGHSQGTTSFYVMLSERPEYNSKVLAHFGYAPSVYLCNINTVGVCLSVPEKNLGYTNFKNMLGDFNISPSLGSFDFFRRHMSLNVVANLRHCMDEPKGIIGLTLSQFSIALIKPLMQFYPDGASAKCMIHYAQEINACEFQKYQETLDTVPDKYKLNNIEVPIFAFYGLEDTVQDWKDTERFERALPAGFKESFALENWNHLDFIMGKDARSIVYDKTLEIMLRLQ